MANNTALVEPFTSVQSAIAEIIRAFDEYPRDAMQYVVDNPDEAKPLVRDYLNLLIHDEDERFSVGYGAMCAFTLCGLWKDVDSHSLLIKICNFPDGEIEFLLGDFIDHFLGLVLMRTAGSDFSQLVALAKETSADEWLRATAMSALSFGVWDKNWPQKIVVDVAVEIVTSEPDINNYCWLAAIHVLQDFDVKEMLPVVRNRYQEVQIHQYEKLSMIEREFDGACQEMSGDMRAAIRLLEDPHSALGQFRWFDDDASEPEDISKC